MRPLIVCSGYAQIAVLTLSTIATIAKSKGMTNKVDAMELR